MLKQYISIISATVLLTACANSFHTYYETGRPMNVETNNARQVVANGWNVSLTYSSSLESVKKHNDSINKIVIEDLGADWLNKLAQESQKELNIHNRIREAIKLTNTFKNAQEKLFEPSILFEKKGKKYIAHIVGQQKSDDTRKFITYARFKVFPENNDTMKLLSEEVEPLTIAFPQNGIK